MSDGRVKNYSARLFFFECPALFGYIKSKHLGILVQRTSEHFNIFYIYFKQLKHGISANTTLMQHFEYENMSNQQLIKITF